MKKLEERIIKEGKIINSDILNVTSFLNHQIDTNLLKEMSAEVKKIFKESVTKVLTIEASGIPFACAIAMEFNVPLVVAKKGKSLNLSNNLVVTKVYSYTHKVENEIYLNSDFIKKGDNVLIADDFLASGEALNGLIDIVLKCQATIVGCVVEIEKEYQNGGNELRKKGYKVISLASIKEMTNNKIIFN